MKINIKTFSAVLFSLFLFSQCMIVSGIGSILQSDGKKSDSSLLGLLALAGGSGSGASATNGETGTGETAPPTVQYSGSPFTFTKDVAIAILTPTITNTPFTNCASSPSLPAGLTLSSSNCTISGTPTIVSPATVYTITASNSFGTGNTTLSIQVMASGIAPTISYSGSPFTFSQSSAISTLTPTLGGGAPTSCSSSPALPAGLTINATSCAISGTPTGTQTATNHTITATNAYGNGTVNISITVNAAGTAPTISYSGSPFTYTQNSAITTLTPTLGGGAPTSCSSSPALPTGLSINATSCAISGTPTGTQTATNHTITATNGFGSNTASISITVNSAGTAPTISYSGSPFTFTQNSAITTVSPTLGGSAPTSCSSSPVLPTGLSINATSCAISGTPTGTQAATSYTITATNAYGNGTASINITVNAAGTAPTISYSGSPFTYIQNSAITTLTPTLGGSAPTGCASSPTLPTGLSINATSCAISGTPTGTQGATNHTITATNAFGSNTASISITVSGTQVAAPTFSLAAGHYNTAQTTTISTTTSGATVYFTTDGTTPTTSSNLYSNPIHIWSLAGKTVKAIAIKSGLSNSSVTTLAGVFSYPPLKTGQTTVYSTGDDGNYQTGVTRSYTGPTQHATYTSDYTTKDNATGLVWKTCSQGLSGSNCGTGSAVQMNWTDAQSGVNGCNALNSANSGNGYAGIKTWRSPSRQELETLPDYETIIPVINTTAFPATVASSYWSSTTNAPITTSAWYVSFGVGVVGSNSKTVNVYVRCVSGL